MYGNNPDSPDATNSVVAIIVLLVPAGAVTAVEMPHRLALINLLSTYCLVVTPNTVVGSAATSTAPDTALTLMYCVGTPAVVALILILPPLILLVIVSALPAVDSVAT